MESAANFRKWILPAIVVPLLLSCILWAVLLGQGVHLLSELDRVGQSDRLIARVHATSRSLTDRETARLGCRVEGSPDLLRAYREADVRLGGDLDELARLVSGDPERSGRLARLRGPGGPRSRDAGEVIGLRLGSPGAPGNPAATPRAGAGTTRCAIPWRTSWPPRRASGIAGPTRPGRGPGPS
jgi:hypothetical protein